MDDQVKCIGHGEFGDIFIGLRRQLAVEFLLKNKAGEMRGAFVRTDIGEIDLIWGEGGSDGYGLAKIAEKHPDAIPGLAYGIENGLVVKSSTDRKIIISDENGQKFVVDLRYKNSAKTWLVTSYVPRPPTS